MATPAPYTPPYQKISDRKINVAMKIGGREDLLQPAPGSTFTYSRISGWLRDAYIAIATCRTFSETEVTYQFQTTLNGDTYTIPTQMRAMKAFTGYDSQGTPIMVSWKDMAYIRRYNAISGTTAPSRPSLWTMFGNQIIFRPAPDNAGGPYTFFLDYWQRPMIAPDIDDTPLLLPDEWLEIVDYSAAVRGNAELQQEDRSRGMQELIYGFTDPTSGRFVPGILERMQNRSESQAPYVDWGIQPPYAGGYTR